MTQHVDHGMRFFNGGVTLIVLGMIGVCVALMAAAISWWTFLVPVGVFMVICLAYGLGWGWDVVKEARHRSAHGG